MSEVIVEVNVENGLPGSRWWIKDDPRYLLAVVYRLKEFQARNTDYPPKAAMKNSDKFVARWQDGYAEIEIPFVDGDLETFLFVLIQTLESIAKVKIEVEWGGKFMKAMLQSKIATPTSSVGGLVL